MHSFRNLLTSYLYYAVFELCKGGTIKSLLDDHDTLPIDIIRHYAMELIEAFEKLQEMHIVHRDIKPANILLDNTFHIVLADFGLAKVIKEKSVYAELQNLNFEKQRELSIIHSTDSSCDDGSGHDNESSCEEKSDEETQGTERNSPTIFDKIFSWITQSESNNSIEELKEKNESSGSSDSDSEDDYICENRRARNSPTKRGRLNTKCGTAPYKAPEMVMYDIACYASDMWALGIILYECICGKHPFNMDKCNNRDKIEKRICNDDVRFPTIRRMKEESQMIDLFDLIKKLLVKDPLKRLGGGLKDSKYSISELKKHPFFEKLNFEDLKRRIPQIQKCKNGYNFIKIKEKFDKLEFSEKQVFTSTKIPFPDSLESDSSTSSKE